MSKKYKFIFCGIAFALAAIIAGLCFVFFGNKTIKATPDSLEVKKIEGDYYLVCGLNMEYKYQFKLEQFIDGEFMVVELVNSDSNTIKLEDSNLNVIAGAEYRFSVRYTNENGGGKGKFSDAIEWSPSWALDGVDYDKVTFSNDLLSWQVVPDADKYTVVIVDSSLQKMEKTCTSESCDLSELKAGKYTAYVIADSFDEFVDSSLAGEGKQFVVRKNNTLTNAQVRENVLTVESEYEIEKLEVFADGISLGSVVVSGRNGKVYRFENLISLFDDIDFQTTKVSVKSKAFGYVLESGQTLVKFV